MDDGEQREFLEALLRRAGRDDHALMTDVRRAVWPMSLVRFKEVMDELEEQGLLRREKSRRVDSRFLLYLNREAIASFLDGPPLPEVARPGALSRPSSLAERVEFLSLSPS